MLLTEIDHVAIAVHDLEAAIDYYQRAFGADGRAPRGRRERRRRGGAAEGGRQLHPAAHADARRLAGRQGHREAGRGPAPRRLPGRRLRARRSAAMVAAGATPIDEAPRPGSRGTTVAFIHPKGSFGTLIELVQE